MLLGIFTTLCIPETKRITLEVLSGEQAARSIGTPDSLKHGQNGLSKEENKTAVNDL
jgi:hypothetical protein